MAVSNERLFTVFMAVSCGTVLRRTVGAVFCGIPGGVVIIILCGIFRGVVIIILCGILGGVIITVLHGVTVVVL